MIHRIKSIFFRNPPVQPLPAPQPQAQGFDFAAAETAFLRKHQIALTSSGALLVATGGSLTPARQPVLDRWLRGYLVEIGTPWAWTSSLGTDFRAWLTASAIEIPVGTFVKAS